MQINKKFTLLVLIVAVTILIMSCSSMNTSNTANRSSTKNQDLLNMFAKIKALEPDNVKDKNLIGSDKTGNYRFKLNSDGSLEYQLNETIFNGTWIYEKGEMYPYRFEWMENDKKQGYIIGITDDGTKMNIYGYWYITDAYITFSKDVQFEEKE